MDELANIVRAMHQLAHAVALLRDPREVVRSAANHLRELLRADGVAIFEWSEPQQLLVAVYSAPEGSPIAPVSRGTGAVGAAFDQRRPVVVDDYPSAPYALPWVVAHGVRAVAAVPLVVGSNVIGAICAARAEPAAYTDSEVGTLEMLGGLGIAPSLELARLRIQLRELAAYIGVLQTRIQTGRLDMPPDTGRLLAPSREPQARSWRLTPREREILPLLAEGRTNREIARALQLSPGTARNMVGRLLVKLGARDRTHAVAIAVARGLLGT